MSGGPIHQNGAKARVRAWAAQSAERRILALRPRYEADVRRLAIERTRLVTAGWDAERIARRLHAMRRRLGLRYKLRTPVFGAKGLISITRRNLRKYGDPLGPSVEQLRARGRTWEQISESACRPGGNDVR
jgi:hypothetical protein